MYIIDTLDDDHQDNTKHYTIAEAIEFAKELLEIDGIKEVVTARNLKDVLRQYCYRIKGVT